MPHPATPADPLTDSRSNSASADPASVLRWGETGPVLVFLHYFSGAAASWQWVAQRLCKDHRCIALDLPGFGQAPPLATPSLSSYAQSVADRIQALGLEQYSLVGHSMGAKIALKLAADHPDHNIEHIFLIAPSPATREPMPSEEKERLLQHHPSTDNAETTVESATQRPLTAEQRSLALQTHVGVEASAWRWWLRQGMEESMAEQARSLQIPVTVLASKDDPVIKFDWVKTDVVELLPQAELVSLEGVGHLVPLEDPEAIASLIRAKRSQTNRE